MPRLYFEWHFLKMGTYKGRKALLYYRLESNITWQQES